MCGEANTDHLVDIRQKTENLVGWQVKQDNKFILNKNIKNEMNKNSCTKYRCIYDFVKCSNSELSKSTRY